MQFEKLGRGEPIVKAEVLGKESNLASRLYITRWAAKNLGFTPRRRNQAQEHFDRGAFACTIWTEKAEDLAPENIEVQVSDRHRAAENFAKSTGPDSEI